MLSWTSPCGKEDTSGKNSLSHNFCNTDINFITVITADTASPGPAPHPMSCLLPIRSPLHHILAPACFISLKPHLHNFTLAFSDPTYSITRLSKMWSAHSRATTTTLQVFDSFSNTDWKEEKGVSSSGFFGFFGEGVGEGLLLFCLYLWFFFSFMLSIYRYYQASQWSVQSKWLSH